MMQRKPGFPVANCSIRMPENLSAIEPLSCEEDGDQQQRRQQLINFGHSQWGFSNWNWSVTKQELDFVDVTSGKYCAGVVAFVSVAVKSLDIHRENIGYATSVAGSKGLAIHRSRKVAVTNALRETLLSFGGAVATELTELLETNREAIEPQPDNQNTANVKEPPLKNVRRDDGPANIPPVQVPHVAPIPVPSAPVIPPMKNAAPIAKAHPMPANTAPPRVSAPAPRPAPPPLHRPNSNVSFVLQPVPPMYHPQRLPHPPIQYPNYYEYREYGPWYYEPHGNVNLNFNLPPKNLVVNSRAGMDCKNSCREGEALQYAQNRGCWIKPTIFYDGFWTEQKVKKWVAEQVEKQFPDEQKAPSPAKDNKSQ